MSKKIYLVEDDDAIIDIYMTMIKKAGFMVESLTLGEEVMKKLKNIENGEETAPDLILLDLTLPDMNGIEILKAVKQGTATKDIAIFVLSNQQTMGETGSDSVKPEKFIIKANITPTQLIDTIKEQLT